MQIPCQVLPLRRADGPANMALDEAMLDAVAGDPSAALFRTYGWTTPTLSLGYFQHAAEARDDPRWRSVPIVRRPTGGGALWHHLELTYALAIPRDHPFARRSRDLYRAVHSTIAALLQAHQINAVRRGDASENGIEGSRPFLCFTDRDAEDIVAGGAKVVGSAQRRRSGAVLQHGSMMVAHSAMTPELLGATDLAPVSPELGYWSDRLLERIPEALGLRTTSIPFPDSLLERATELERTVYRNDAWTYKR